MAGNYEWVTDEMFGAQLEETLSDMDAVQVLQIPGVYALVREHLNNDVLCDLVEVYDDLHEIYQMTRDEIIERLEEVCIHCEEGEALSVLREALVVNVKDGTVKL